MGGCFINRLHPHRIVSNQQFIVQKQSFKQDSTNFLVESSRASNPRSRRRVRWTRKNQCRYLQVKYFRR